jgi:tRNA 2-thiouridine synthesizing protein B
MSTLHTVNKSPYERGSLASCLKHTLPGDAVLLIEDAVVAARKTGTAAAQLTAAAQTCAVYVLGPDLAARGVPESALADGVKIVDYAGFVDLAVQHTRTQSWL